MNHLKKHAAIFTKKVKINKFVSNAVNAKNTFVKKIQRSLLCVMFVLNLVKVECFKDCLDIFCLIKEYLGIISYLNNFYCNDFCFFVHI